LETISHSGNASLFYKYAPELIESIPEELVKALIDNEFSILKPTLLLPTLYRCLEIPPGQNQDAVVGIIKSVWLQITPGLARGNSALPPAHGG